MARVARWLGLLAVAALLVVGAAGLSGHLVDDDPCSGVSGQEGTSVSSETRWAPPGHQCVFERPSATTADGRFLYDGSVQRGEQAGSWAGFVGALLVGFGVVGSAVRRRPRLPAWLRLTAVATLAFAVAGAGALVGGWQASVLAVTLIGVPVAFAAERWLLPGRGLDHQTRAGVVGAAVAFAAAVVASTAWLVGLGLAGLGLALLLVAAVAAVPWRRSAPRPVPA